MRRLSVFFLLSVLLLSCRHYDSGYSWRHQDKDAKQMMQGIWIDDEEGVPVFMVKGDSVLFPDTTSMPMRVWIYQDSLYLQGNGVDRYLVTRQTEHVFRFVNQGGEEVKLVKVEDSRLQAAFFQERPYALNIFRTLSLDTLVTVASQTYHCNIQVEPTSNRIIASSFTDQGIRVDNMYLNNNARVRVWRNQVPFYEHHFQKQEFSAFVPKEFLDKAILSNVLYDRADTAAVYLDAVIGIPDASSAFVIEMKIGNKGKVLKRLK